MQTDQPYPEVSHQILPLL